ncbi:MAG TPA: class F sortase [Pseudonocardiaceae bacterium]|nr:class F sortase [Pseudonocardiaceae bacterium]
MTRSTSRTGSWPVGVAVALCAVATAVTVLAGCGSGQNVPVSPGKPETTTVLAPTAGSGGTSLANESTRSLSALPASVRIPSINATSSLVALGQNADGTVQVPPVSTPMQAGWYAGSSAPGEPGPAVLLGHVDGDKQIGIFFRLHELKAGDQVLITRTDGSVLTFKVTKVDKVAKSAFPTQSVYGPTKDAELRLLTCGGAFDHAAHSYVDNVIVYAKLVT